MSLYNWVFIEAVDLYKLVEPLPMLPGNCTKTCKCLMKWGGVMLVGTCNREKLQGFGGGTFFDIKMG